jgi:hypothetical protein
MKIKRTKQRPLRADSSRAKIEEILDEVALRFDGFAWAEETRLKPLITAEHHLEAVFADRMSRDFGHTNWPAQFACLHYFYEKYAKEYGWFSHTSRVWNVGVYLAWELNGHAPPEKWAVKENCDRWRERPKPEMRAVNYFINRWFHVMVDGNAKAARN